MKFSRRNVLGGALGVTSIAAAARANGASLQRPRSAVAQEILAEFEVPGLSLAIVDKGHVTLEAYGIRTLGDGAPVTRDTTLPIASNTKAFTATAIMLLVQDGRLSLDGRVGSYLPGFELHDETASAEITVKDLLCHRSGLGEYQGDLLWTPGTTYSRGEIVKRLRYLPPKAAFRSIYAYSNVGYIVLGEIISTVSGMSYEDFIRRRILEPLGMRSTTFLDGRSTNTSFGHARWSELGRGVGPLRALSANDAVVPSSNAAGGLISSAQDMSVWIAFHLSGGRTRKGSRLLRSNLHGQLWQSIIQMPPGQSFDDGAQVSSAYALGFRRTSYRGTPMILHGGAVNGAFSQLVFLPTLNWGACVLTNAEERYAYRSLLCSMLDERLGLHGTPVAHFAAKRRKEMAETEAAYRARLATKQPTDQLPPVDPTRLVGRYEDRWYGGLTIVDQNGQLYATFEPSPKMHGPLSRWSHDSFLLSYADPLIDKALLRFRPGIDGATSFIDVEALTVGDPSYDYSDLGFQRKL